jgi:hypothetical protein
MLPDVGRMLVFLGVAIAVLGLLLLVLARLPYLGHLPGDLSFGRGNLRVYVPLATSLLLSLVLTILLNLFARR